MAYDEDLAERVRALVGRMGETNEISMFGGLCFTLNGNMFVGVMKDDLMVRVGPEDHACRTKTAGGATNGLHQETYEGLRLCQQEGNGQRSVAGEVGEDGERLRLNAATEKAEARIEEESEVLSGDRRRSLH